MRIRILPYRQGSKGAKALADALGGKVLKLEGSTWKAKAGDKVIVWGNTNTSTTFNGIPCPILNDPAHIVNASNKLKFFNMMKEVAPDDIPQFWTKKEDIPEDAYPVVCRTVLAGHSGDGIVIADDSEGLVAAPLYVRYMKKKDEFRIHVGRKTQYVGENDHEPSESGVITTFKTIAVQRKARRTETPDEEVNWKVRNLAGGFIFQRNNVNVPDKVVEAAHRALAATNLDFGAVDVIWNENQEKAYVLEINTAPGLEGSTVQDYRAFFSDL